MTTINLGLGMKSSAEKDLPRKKSAERLGELRSRYMEIAVKLPIAPDLGVQRSILSCQRFSFQCFSFIQSPPLPDRISSVFSALGEKANS